MDVETVIRLCAAVWIASHFISMIGFLGTTTGLSFFNPIRNYKTWTRMNWFGVILGTTGLHLLLPVYAVCYWFYKLCTFGRKQE